MLPTSAGVEPATSWSPVGRRIQLSHRGQLGMHVKLFQTKQEDEDFLYLTTQKLSMCLSDWSGKLFCYFFLEKDLTLKYIPGISWHMLSLINYPVYPPTPHPPTHTFIIETAVPYLPK